MVFQSFPAIYLFWSKGNPKNFRPFKIFEMALFYIRRLQKRLYMYIYANLWRNMLSCCWWAAMSVLITVLFSFTSSLSLRTQPHIYVHISTHICTYMYNMYIHVHKRTYMYMYMYIYANLCLARCALTRSRWAAMSILVQRLTSLARACLS